MARPEDSEGNNASTESMTSNEATITNEQSVRIRNAPAARKQQVSVDNEEKNFLGKTKEMEAVLGLRNERLNYKMPFDTFREKLSEYTLKNFSGARHVMP